MMEVVSAMVVKKSEELDIKPKVQILQDWIFWNPCKQYLHEPTEWKSQREDLGSVQEDFPGCWLSPRAMGARRQWSYTRL